MENRHAYILALVAFLLIGSVVVGTIEFTEEWKKVAPATCEEVMMQINYVWLPQSLTDVSMGKTVNLHFNMINGNEISYYGVISRKALRDLECGRSEDYDFEVWMGDLEAFEMATSTKPINTAVRLWKEGRVIIEANGSENEEILEKADELAANEYEPVPFSIRYAFLRYLE